MRNFLIGVVVTLAAAFTFETAGMWWAMPVAGAVGGWVVKKGGQGFLAGALGVTLVWGAYLALFAAASPLGELLRLFAGIVELGDALSFIPVALALVIAFLMGGLGGMTGAMIAGVRGESEKR